MSRIEALSEAYLKHISAPWVRGLSGAQKVITLVYDKSEERRLRSKKQLFEIATNEANHKWAELDLIDAFPHWMAEQEYREAYFESPDDLSIKMGTNSSEFTLHVADRLRRVLVDPKFDEQTVIAVFGVAGLYGFSHVSDVIHHIENDIKGRLLLFFPGEFDNNNYRLMDARDGWNYHAVPITIYNRGLL